VGTLALAWQYTGSILVGSKDNDGDGPELRSDDGLVLVEGTSLGSDEGTILTFDVRLSKAAGSIDMRNTCSSMALHWALHLVKVKLRLIC
jgi:hypothetical protein